MLNYSTPRVYISSIGHLRLHDQCKQDWRLVCTDHEEEGPPDVSAAVQPSLPTLSVFISRVNASVTWGGAGRSRQTIFFSPSRLSPGDRTHVWPFSFGVMSPAELEQRTPLREVEHDCRAAGEKSADVCQAGTG